MNKENAIELLRLNANAMRALGARSLYLFGSVARREARPDSDIDLFVDYDENFSAVELVRLRNYIEQLLHTRVDVTTREGLHPLISEEIVATAEKVF